MIDSLIYLLPVIVSGILGFTLDIKYKVQSPILYWNLGAWGVFLMMLM